MLCLYIKLNAYTRQNCTLYYIWIHNNTWKIVGSRFLKTHLFADEEKKQKINTDIKYNSHQRKRKKSTAKTAAILTEQPQSDCHSNFEMYSKVLTFSIFSNANGERVTNGRQYDWIISHRPKISHSEGFVRNH